MSVFDTLGALAQVGIALAGFASVVVAFRRSADDGSWLPEDVFRLKSMLILGLASGFLALLPAVASALHPASDALWRALDVAMLAIVASVLAWVVRSARRMAPGRLSRPLYRAIVSGLALAIAAQGLGASGSISPSGAYVAAAGYFALLAGVLFYRLTTAPIDAGR